MTYSAEIAKTEDIILHFQSGWRDEIIVTFNGMLVGDNIRGEFAAQSPLKKLGYPTIGFQATKSNWYPAAQMRRLAPAAWKILDNYKVRIGYGYSMGAYGAIRHSSLLRLKKTFALSPQWAIDPSIAPWENRYTDHVLPGHEDVIILPSDCSGEFYVVYDNIDAQENAHVREIARQTPIFEIKVPGVSHSTLELIAGSTILGDCLELISRSSVDDLRKTIRQRRAGFGEVRSNILHQRALRLFLMGDLSGAERFSRLALQSPGRNAHIGWLLPRILNKMKRHIDAELAAASEVARYPDNYSLVPYLAECLEAQGRIDEAASVCMDAFIRHPNHGLLRSTLERLATKSDCSSIEELMVLQRDRHLGDAAGHHD